MVLRRRSTIACRMFALPTKIATSMMMNQWQRCETKNYLFSFSANIICTTGCHCRNHHIWRTSSEGQISPILAGPCLVKDNTALGTVPAPRASSHYHPSLNDHRSLACSRVGSRHALCEINAVQQRLTIKRVLSRSLRPLKSSAASMHPCKVCKHAAAAACCAGIRVVHVQPY